MIETVGVAVLVTALVTVASAFMPERFVATSVGFVFLGATWVLVWRKDDKTVERAGLALGGLVLPGKVDGSRLLRSAGVAILWALACAAITFVPFFFGWKALLHPRGSFTFALGPVDLLNDLFGQLVIIALPEEAFYRGYLQSRLDEVFVGRARVLGASVGPAIFVTSVVFALGHLATIREPSRLAVFFPSLLFGWLRARTGGIGASLAFHAACNVWSEMLGKGYRVY